MDVKIILDPVTNLTWGLKLVRVGEAYGAGNVLVNEGPEPYVEFYDTRFPHTPLGQFVSRYYLSTLLDIPANKGLCLYGGVPSWVVSIAGITAAKEWLTAARLAPAVMSNGELVIALRKAVERLAIEKGGLALNAAYADGRWRVGVLADGVSTSYEAYAKETRGSTGNLQELAAWELVGLLGL